MLPDGTYDYTVSKNGYETVKGKATTNGKDITETIALQTNANASFSVGFTVKNEGDGIISGAQIVFDGETASTDAKGQVIFIRQNGVYSYAVSKDGYLEQNNSIIIDGNIVNDEIVLLADNTIKKEITFNIKSGFDVLTDAVISVNGMDIITDAGGKAYIELPKGTYSYTVAKEQYVTSIGTINVEDEAVTLNINILPKTDLSEEIDVQGLAQTYTGNVCIPTVLVPNELNFIIEYEGMDGTEYSKTTQPPVEIGKYKINISIVDEYFYGNKTFVMEIKEKVKTPTANIPSGLAIIAGKLILSTQTEDAIIYYTTDGDDPTTASQKYTEPIVINKDTKTIKAIAVKNGCYDSEVFVLDLTPVPLYDGNVNGDDKIDMLDAFTILKYTVDLVEFTEAQKAAADANKDGQINILDALLIQRYTIYYSE